MLWDKPWTYKEGFIIGGGLVLTGALLEFAVGGINWDLIGWPLNLIVLAMLVALIVLMHCLRKRVYLFGWLSTVSAAVPAIVVALVMTVLMGLIQQVPDGHQPTDALGLTQMTRCWPFVLVYVWIAVIMALSVLRRLSRPRWRDIPFYLSHGGLLLALVAATLGSADMQRLSMTVASGAGPEWRGVDSQGNVVELPIAVELERFEIDEYPAQVVLVNRQDGHVMDARPAVTVLDTLDKAAPMSSADSTWYVTWPSSGAVTALYVEAQGRRGWISGGSYLFPTQWFTLNDSTALAMAQREPKSYRSVVDIYTQTGKHLHGAIEVNKPVSVDGWKIYQLSYDASKGRWSDVSVLEFVTDPWLPAVYVGIGMMMLGAIALLAFQGRRKEGKS